MLILVCTYVRSVQVCLELSILITLAQVSLKSLLALSHNSLSLLCRTDGA